MGSLRTSLLAVGDRRDLTALLGSRQYMHAGHLLSTEEPIRHLLGCEVPAEQVMDTSLHERKADQPCQGMT